MIFRMDTPERRKSYQSEREDGVEGGKFLILEIRVRLRCSTGNVKIPTLSHKSRQGWGTLGYFSA